MRNITIMTGQEGYVAERLFEVVAKVAERRKEAARLLQNASSVGDLTTAICELEFATADVGLALNGILEYMTVPRDLTDFPETAPRITYQFPSVSDALVKALRGSGLLEAA